MTPHLRFLEHGNAVGEHLEPPATGRHQGYFSIGEPLTNLRRQTGSASFVASHRAVFDRDRHARKASKERWEMG